MRQFCCCLERGLLLLVIVGVAISDESGNNEIGQLFPEANEPFGLLYGVDLEADIVEIRRGEMNISLRISSTSSNANNNNVKYVVCYCDSTLKHGHKFCTQNTIAPKGPLTTSYLWWPSEFYNVALFTRRIVGFREFEEARFAFGNVSTTPCDDKCFKSKRRNDRTNMTVTIVREIDETLVVDVLLSQLNLACINYPVYPLTIRADYITNLGERGYILFRNARLKSFRLKVQSKKGKTSFLIVEGYITCSGGRRLDFFIELGEPKKSSDTNGYIDELLAIVREVSPPLLWPETIQDPQVEIENVRLTIKQITRDGNTTLKKVTTGKDTPEVVVTANVMMDMDILLDFDAGVSGWAIVHVGPIDYTFSITSDGQTTQISNTTLRGFTGLALVDITWPLYPVANAYFESQKEEIIELLTVPLTNIGTFVMNLPLDQVDINHFISIEAYNDNDVELP